ncbi:MAG: hypothetical protein V4691_05140 [Pseudomonadota bacterium]
MRCKIKSGGRFISARRCNSKMNTKFSVFGAVILAFFNFSLETTISKEICQDSFVFGQENAKFAACQVDQLKQVDIHRVSAEKIAKKIVYDLCKLEAEAVAELAARQQTCDGRPRRNKEVMLQSFVTTLKTEIEIAQ